MSDELSSDEASEAFCRFKSKVEDGGLGHLLCRFRSLDTDRSGSITPRELASHCLQAAQEAKQRPLNASEQQLVLLSVTRSFETMDLKADGELSRCEWLHAGLLELQPIGRVSLEVITEQLKQRPEGLEALVRSWLEVDEQAEGLVTRRLLEHSGKEASWCLE